MQVFHVGIILGDLSYQQNLTKDNHRIKSAILRLQRYIQIAQCTVNDYTALNMDSLVLWDLSVHYALTKIDRPTPVLFQLLIKLFSPPDKENQGAR